jgi:CRISPR/Cas system-associated endoribonuclease Cas2
MTKIPIQNHRKMAVRTAVLRMLYISGMLSVAILAPHAARLLPAPDRSKKHRVRLYSRIIAARARLKYDGYLEEKGGQVRLTNRGVRVIERLLLREYRIREQIHWDGKWRILMFDIREKRRRARLTLRQLLQGAGFVRLQDSVWVYPYPCDEFVALVRAHLSSGVGELRSLAVDALESDQSLREHFNLI